MSTTILSIDFDFAIVEDPRLIIRGAILSNALNQVGTGGGKQLLGQ